METLFWIGFILLVGYAVGLFSERYGWPKVTGYLLIGLVLSPSVSGVLPASFIAGSSAVIHLALTIIAFMIGGSLRIEKVRKLEKSIFAIMIGESETAFLFVSVGLALLLPFLMEADHAELTVIALFLGAISAATAPAAVLAIVHQYRAKGPLTLTILGVVATDDAVALINFSIVTGVASVLLGTHETTMMHALLGPILSIAASVCAGAAAGWFQAKHLARISQENNQVLSTIGVLLLMYGAAESFGGDGVLTSMSYGFVLINSSHRSEGVMDTVRLHFEEFIFVLFFIISGATMELSVLAEVWPMAAIYVVLRLSGKVIGSRTAARLSGAPDVVRRHIGPALMPQAGVAIGLSLTLYHDPVMGPIGVIVLNCVIAATVINEIAGPLLLKRMLMHSGEAKEVP